MNCKSLNFALGGVNLSITTVQLSSGSVSLSISNTTISDLSDFTIVGNGITATTIQCSNARAGLFFTGMSGLTLANLTISHCGMLQNSTTCNGSSLVQYPSAITIHNSTNVTIHSVSFTFNNGIGLSMVNTGGNVTIRGSTFDGNYVTDGSHPGGGGLYIEFPVCITDNLASFNNHLNSNSHYTIDACYFTNNMAKKMDPPPSYKKKLSDTCICAEQTFGHGGGMSVFFRGYSTNNIIDITNTDFVNNTAVWGGGLFIEFHHYASGNKVNIEGYSQFSNNSCTGADTGGGGVQIAYTPYDSLVSSSNNSVALSQCKFTGNTAYWGGGVSYVIITELHATGTNTLYFSNCQWQHNKAKFGAAVDLSLYRSLTSGVAQAVVFESCSFVGNTIMFNLQSSEFQLHGGGVVYANSIIIQLRKQADFTNNTGSALVLSDSYVNVTNGCSVTFIHNRGWRGGALFLLPLSWMMVEANTKILFLKNYADEVGGAVYAELTNEHNVISQWNCFIQYSDTTISPDEWNTSIVFQDNKSGHRGHSIYATTIRSCVWGKSYRNANINDTKDAFHWNSFTFNGKSGKENFTRDSEIATAANVFSITNETTITVFPGEEYHLPFTQHDDEGHTAKALLFIQPFANSTEGIGVVDNRSVYVYSNIMQVYGDPNTNASFSVTNSGPMPSSKILNVKFDYCPPGYVGYRKDNVTFCECADSYPNGIPGIVECNSTLSRAYIARLRWGGVYNDGIVEEFVTAVCNKGYCYFNNSDRRYKMLLPSSRSELEFCSRQNRVGMICGECKPGYSMSSRSNCIKCKHGTTKGILLFILYECLPTLLFVFVILIFNVHITSGNWNSIIFYFQMVENLNLYASQLTSDYSKPVQILIEFHTNAFGVWNLDFFQSIKPEECYINGMKNAFQFYLLNYSTLIFPLGLIFAITRIKNCNYRLNCCNRDSHYQQNVDKPYNICTKCKQKYKKFTSKWKDWFGQTSLIHGFATFIVLSYTKVALLSMFFFIPGPLYGPGGHVYETRANDVGTLRYFSQEHVAYLFPAFIFLMMAVIFQCYLILKPLIEAMSGYYGKEEQCTKCDAAICCIMDMSRVTHLLEEFYRPFKKECRFYAGFFFLYRLAIYATIAFTTSLQTQYCIQQCILVAILFIHSVLQPYDEKHKLANIIDALIFLNLNCINALSVYNYYSVIDIQSESNAVIAVQLVLVYLPLFYIPFRFIWWFRKTCCKRGTDHRNTDVIDEVHPQIQNYGALEESLLDFSYLQQ